MSETEIKFTEEQEKKMSHFKEVTENLSKAVESKKYDMDVYVAALVSHLASLAFSQGENGPHCLKQLHEGIDSVFNDLKSEFGDHQCSH